MVTISIPQIKKGDFILVSRQEYQRLIDRGSTKSKKTAKKKAKSHFLKEALEDIEKGNVDGPYSTVKELRKSLK